MLGILLGILKVLGIIIAAILGLVILILLLVLFVPIRYSANGEYNDRQYGRGSVTWLLHLIGVYVTFDGKLNFKIRILCFNIKDTSKTQETAKKVKESKKQKPKKKKKNKTYDSKKSDENIDLSDDHIVDYQSEMKSDDYYEESANELTTEEDYIPEKKEKKKNKIKDIVNSIRNTITKIKDKTVSVEEMVKEKYNKFTGIINNTEYKELITFLLGQLKILVGKIKPTKYNINVLYGLDDPSTTGKILGYYYMFYGFTGFRINITPDFEKKIIEADGFVKGKIRLISLVIIGLRVYTNKLFKKYILKKKNHK